MRTRALYIFIIGVLLAAHSCKQQEEHPQTAKACLEEAEAALANDSIRLGVLKADIQFSY
jgi:hypothetical protein